MCGKTHNNFKSKNDFDKFDRSDLVTVGNAQCFKNSSTIRWSGTDYLKNINMYNVFQVLFSMP